MELARENTEVLLVLLFFLSVLCLIFLILLLSNQKKERAKRRRELDALFQNLSAATERSLRFIPSREEYQTQMYQSTQQLLGQMNELTRTELNRFDTLDARFELFTQTHEGRLRAQSQLLDEKLRQSEQRIEKMRETLEKSVSSLQMENSRKLDEMRQTVDEKLHSTLEKRLAESFQVVSAQLEQVSKGLGEMRSLANGVGDLKRVLTNVKTRGVWGEMQLGALLEQVLAKNQYDENVAVVPDSQQRVEFAVRMPGRDDETVYLPIDAKFPVEDYERLLTAHESGTTEQIQAAQKALEDALRTEAKRIASKYIAPPHTTDFAVMFLPTEGLYAEALRSRGLAEELQEKQHILIAGPMTLTALLTSLQVGFRTLAIEKRSGEVWKLLSAVKTDFSRFAELLDAAQQKMRMASDSIEKATSRSHTIERKLRKVEELDVQEAAAYLEMPSDDEKEGASQ